MRRGILQIPLVGAVLTSRRNHGDQRLSEDFMHTASLTDLGTAKGRIRKCLFDGLHGKTGRGET